MPFYWRRRRKPWFGRWRQRRYNTYKRRKPKRRYRKRRYRRAPRRRRRRRGKVRRKKKTITVKQWQPDSIVNCKIKGYGSLVLGAEGCQYLCYTNEKPLFVPPQYPYGGGFGVERYTLQYLYEEYIFRNCIWTKTNTYKDLCRYLRCKFIFYRHPKCDFVINYNRQPPFQIDKHTYTLTHPYMLLQSKHKKVLLSTQTNPRGKTKLVMNIKPPKQMLSKWFFQKEFAVHDLVQISAAAASFQYPRLGCCNENRTISIYYLNPQFFVNSDWAATRATGPYLPYAGISTNLTYWTKQGNQTVKYKPQFFTKKTQEGYYESINKDTGWFGPKILNAYKVTDGEYTEYAHLPLSAARYNPAEDNGQGNKVYLVSVTGGNYTKPQDQVLIYENAPLWLLFYGYWSYIVKLKTSSIMGISMFVIESPYILPKPSAITKQYYPIVDFNMALGNNPYKAYISNNQSKFWYPTAHHQIETLNSFVQCGPYIPKYNNDRESTWELPYHYIFYFKWGGPEITDQPVQDPKHQQTYPVPDRNTETVQVSNPLKQTTESILHDWDYRRGFITNTALKRMCQDLQTDTTFQSDTEKQKKRKRVTSELPNPEEKIKKVKTCLQELCKSDSSQEEEDPPNILKLIHKQREQQQQLKHNILILIQEMKRKQNLLQLTTGMLD
nr:MAG: ORF1 [Torque teno midi virus]